MGIAILATLDERIRNLFAQGLQIAAPDELEVLAQELSRLQLAQPAALLRQIQPNVVTRTVAQKDVEALVKVLQILTQAEIHLSATRTVALAELITSQGVCLPAAELPQTDERDLNAILQISNPFVRGAQVAAYYQRANAAELEQSIARVWFDYALASAICEGLRGRLTEAFSLARKALAHENLVIRRTALKVLASVGQEPAHTQATLNLLRNFLDRATVPLVHFVTEAIARLEGRYADYFRSQCARLEQWAPTVKSLKSGKKGERALAARDLAQIKDPSFTEVLLRALYAETDTKISKAILAALVASGSFEAIPYLTGMLSGEYAHDALAALAKFGDRSLLAFLTSPAGLNTPPAYYQSLLPPYGLLAVNPLLTAIKTLADPGAYKTGFRHLCVGLRSYTFAQAILDQLERDARLMEKFLALFQRMYPKLLKKSDLKLAQGAGLSAALKHLLLATLGGEGLRVKESVGRRR